MIERTSREQNSRILLYGGIKEMMRNREVLNEIKKQSRTLIEEKRDKFVKQSLLSDEFLDMMQRNRKPFDLLMSYYQCAIMEIETKFKVLNEEYSLEYDKNPIEGIKSRIKSYDSLLKKIRRKDIPMTLESIEKNITDIAGVRVICSFPADIYEVADSFLRQDDITLLERKDYIQNPKPSGYRSLHLIVQVPIFLQNEKTPVTGILRVCKAMGADITLLNERTAAGEPVADLLVRHSELHGTVIEGELIPTLIDEIPILAVLAAYANGTTVIRNAEELKVKESNRLDIMVNSLGAMGCDIEGTDDGMIIRGGKPLHHASIDSHLDHRIAMSFAVAGLISEGGVEVLRADCVDISYPEFYADLGKLMK